MVPFESRRFGHPQKQIARTTRAALRIGFGIPATRGRECEATMADHPVRGQATTHITPRTTCAGTSSTARSAYGRKSDGSDGKEIILEGGDFVYIQAARSTSSPTRRRPRRPRSCLLTSGSATPTRRDRVCRHESWRVTRWRFSAHASALPADARPATSRIISKPFQLMASVPLIRAWTSAQRRGGRRDHVKKHSFAPNYDVG